MDNNVETIKECLKKNDVRDSEISNNDYIENEILDSIQIVGIISDIENAFNIVIDAEDITPENFTNMETIVHMVKKYGIL